MSQKSHADAPLPVVIVGAGPTGLSLALGLARFGIRSVVVEKDSATSEHSKAPGIHVRTREILRQWGVEQRFREEGVLKRELVLHNASGGRPLAIIDFSEIDDQADDPGILFLEQGRTEKLLLEAVRETGLCEVRFDAEAISLTQDGTSARLTIRESGSQATLEASFVVGCDGANSFVRTALRQPFAGQTYSVRPILADVRIEDERDSLPWPRMRNSRRGLTLTFRLSPGHWRIIHLDRGHTDAGEKVPDEEVQSRVEAVLGKGPAEVIWASRFRIHRRASPRFRVGRVLLAGDAAHVHSPVGGLGMNAGIQDAHNLAWKLAEVTRGGDADSLLNSYDIERREVVVDNVSRFTDLLTRAFLQTPALIRGGAFAMWRSLFRVPQLRRKGIAWATMIDLSYASSPILDDEDLAAGVRLPNPRLRAPDGSEVRLYDLLSIGPAILDVADGHHFEVDLPLEDVIRISDSAHRDPTGALRDLLDGENGWILVRPDRHVAWARHRLGGIRVAVENGLGWGGDRGSNYFSSRISP